MTGYLLNFTIYTMAMVGVLFLALFTFKSFSGGCFSKKSAMLNVEDTMKLSTRKSLFVINADGERFLIASDMERTSLISKLNKKDEKNLIKEQKEQALDVCFPRVDKSRELKTFDGIDSLDEFVSIIDFKRRRDGEGEKKGPMMKELAKKLSTM